MKVYSVKEESYRPMKICGRKRNTFLCDGFEGGDHYLQKLFFMRNGTLFNSKMQIDTGF